MSATTTTPLRCAHCGREWRDNAERWQGYIASEEEREDEFTGPDIVEVLCRECAERAFGAAR